MTCSLRVLCVSYGGTSPCLVLSTDNQRFLFDSGEGVQRLCIEHRVRLSKLEGVFLTFLSQETVAGLPGLALTCAESGKNGLQIIGPRGLRSFWNSTSNFTYRPQFEIALHEQLTSLESREFEKVFIHCLAFGRQSSTTTTTTTSSLSSSSSSHLCYVVETKPLPGKFDIARAKELGVPIGPLLGQLQNGKSIVLNNGQTITPEEVVSPAEKCRYSIIICNCCSFEMILELIQNPFWSRFFKNGENIDQLDCVFHLSPSSVTKSSEYSMWMNQFVSPTQHIMVGEGDCQPQSAFQASTIYTAKLHKLFPDHFSNLTISNHLLNPLLHRHHNHQHEQLRQGLELELEQNQEHQQEHIDSHLSAYPGLTFNQLPSRVRGLEPFSINQSPITGPITLACQSLIQEEVNQFWKEMKGDEPDSQISLAFKQTQKIRSHLLETLIHQDLQSTIYCDDNSIMFLGTGCAQPSKYRNVSGIFVQLDGGAMLLDCGEGSWQQLIRMASHTPAMVRMRPEQRRNSNSSADVDIPFSIAEQLKIIWISHPHADHHLGVIRVISERRRLLSSIQSFEPLLLIAPESVLSFVRAFEEFDPFLRNSYHPVNNRCFDSFELKLRCNPCGEEDSSMSAVRYYGPRLSNGDEINQLQKKRVVDTPESLEESLHQLALAQPILTSLGIDVFENIQVIHCSQSYAVSIVSKKGWKLVYSGDTRPCHRLIEMGKGATVLIHEATFSDNKADEALKKKHSTISEAIQVAQQMNAHHLILTHFSQRYPSTPPLPPHCLDLEHSSSSSLSTSSSSSSSSSTSSITTVKVILAYDFMRLTFQDCSWAHGMNLILTHAFPPEEETELERDNDEKDMTTTQRVGKRSKNETVSLNNSKTRTGAEKKKQNTSESQDISPSENTQRRKSKKVKSELEMSVEKSEEEENTIG